MSDSELDTIDDLLDDLEEDERAAIIRRLRDDARDYCASPNDI